MLNKEMEGFEMQTVHMESFLAGMEYQKQLLKEEKKKKVLSRPSTHYISVMNKLAIIDPQHNSFITKEEMKKNIMNNLGLTPQKFNPVLRQIGCREVKRHIEGKQKNCWLFTTDAIKVIQNYQN